MLRMLERHGTFMAGTISNIDDPKGISSSRRPGAKVQASDYDELSVLLDLLPLHIQELVHAHPEFDQVLAHMYMYICMYIKYVILIEIEEQYCC